MASMTVPVSGAGVASTRAGARTQWPARSPVPARPRVGRSRVAALVTRAAKKARPASVETQAAPFEAPSAPPVPAGGLPPPSGYVPPPRKSASLTHHPTGSDRGTKSHPDDRRPNALHFFSVAMHSH